MWCLKRWEHEQKKIFDLYFTALKFEHQQLRRKSFFFIWINVSFICSKSIKNFQDLLYCKKFSVNYIVFENLYTIFVGTNVQQWCTKFMLIVAVALFNVNSQMFDAYLCVTPHQFIVIASKTWLICTTRKQQKKSHWISNNIVLVASICLPLPAASKSAELTIRVV